MTEGAKKLLLCALLAQGCGETHHSKGPSSPVGWSPTPPPGAWERTPAGGEVWLPDFAVQDRAAVFAEIDSTLPLAVTGPAGIPVHWALVVLNPGEYPSLYAGVVIRIPGHTNFETSTIYVAWQTDGPGFLPALSHELAHAVTGDPKQGHP